VGEEDKR